MPVISRVHHAIRVCQVPPQPSSWSHVSREGSYKWWSAVQGLTHAELRQVGASSTSSLASMWQVGEKLQEQPEHVNEREKRAEFTAPSWQVTPELISYELVWYWSSRTSSSL